MPHEKELTFVFPVPRRQQRFREVVIYIAEKCRDAEFFGAVKLNKILYHADFRAFRRLGMPITGVGYFRLRHGPAPIALVPVRRELEIEGAITIEHRPMGNHIQDRIVPRRRPYLNLFTPDELDIVDEVIHELWSHTAEQVSDASHDVIWRTRRNREPIPYEAAYLSNDPLTADEIARTRELADELGWRDE
jgi:Protein of unknown function (DUF4065)